MKGELVLAVLLAQATAPAMASVPAPQATPLKQIIDVKSRSLCTVLRDNVAVSLVGLMKNDEIIAVGRNAMQKMGDDRVKGSKALPMDQLFAENAVGSMVHNLAEIDRVLDDPVRFPPNPKTNDEILADQVKTQLSAVEAEQKNQLNALNGTIETDALNSMQHDLPAFSPAATPGGAAVASPAPTTIANAGLPNSPSSPAATDPRALLANGLAGNTLYGRLAALMGAEQGRTASVERVAAASVAQAAAMCGASK